MNMKFFKLFLNIVACLGLLVEPAFAKAPLYSKQKLEVLNNSDDICAIYNSTLSQVGNKIRREFRAHPFKRWIAKD